MATHRSTDEGRTPRESGTEGGKRVASEASQATETAKEEAQRLSEQARGQIATRAEQQKSRATERLEGIGAALHETSSTLQDRDQESVADFIDGAAHQVERLADYLRHHSVNDMMAEVEGYARREPEVFLGSAMLLGLIGTRFFMSSSPEGRRRSREVHRGTPRAGYEARREYATRRSPSRHGERDRPTVAGTSGGEVPDPSRAEGRRSEADTP